MEYGSTYCGKGHFVTDRQTDGLDITGYQLTSENVHKWNDEIRKHRRSINYSPEQAPPVKAIVYVLDVITLTRGACSVKIEKY